MRFVFVKIASVSKAEIIMPACDVSNKFLLQVKASGTGNIGLC